MIVDAIGLIVTDTKAINIAELTEPRALAALPFCGRYRVIDFMLSNLVNMGVSQVGVAAYNKYKSLMDHLGTGSAWDLSRKNQGLNIIPPYIISDYYSGGNDLAGILNFLKYKKKKHVIICGSSTILNMDFSLILEDHIQSGADITLLYSKTKKIDASPQVILDFDRKNHLKGSELSTVAQNKTLKTFLDVMVIEREILVQILNDLITKGKRDSDFFDIFSLYNEYVIRGYEYKGFYLKVNSVSSYFQSTMECLNPEAQKALFWSEKPVYTKVKDEAPSYYSSTSEVSNSMISDGCIIEGQIENSMIFRGVTLGKNSKIKNCIIFQNVVISENCELENVIIDKYVHIRPGVKLASQAENPIVIGKGHII